MLFYLVRVFKLTFQLPAYTPETPKTRAFIFPLELKLTHQDIADIVNWVIPPERSPPGFNSSAIITDMCDVQASGMVEDR